MKKYSKIIFALVTFGAMLPAISSVSAQTPAVKLYFKELPAAYPDFSVQVSIDSNAPVNAYDLSVLYPKNILQLKNLSNAGSIIDIWQSNFQQNDTGEVSVKGGSVKPFSGSAGNIITLNFRAKSPGNINFSFGKTAVYLANGQGTLAQNIEAQNANFILNQTPAPQATIQSGATQSSAQAAPKISSPPEITSLSIEPNPFISGENLLIFNVKSDSAGINSVMAQNRAWLGWSQWQEIKNPYPLPDGVWEVRLRALDNSGNYSEKTITVKGEIEKRILEIAAAAGLLILLPALTLKSLFGKQRTEVT